MPNPFMPPFTGRSEGLGLISVGNTTGVVPGDSTDAAVLS